MRCVWQWRKQFHQNRGWKLFLLLPRLMLHRPPRGGKVHRSKLVERFDDFARGSWNKSVKCDEDAATAHTRKRRRHQVGDVQHRAARALALVQIGEFFAGHQALEGAELAPGSEETQRVEESFETSTKSTCTSTTTNNGTCSSATVRIGGGQLSKFYAHDGEVQRQVHLG